MGTVETGQTAGVNPNSQVEEDPRTPAQLIAIIEQQGQELAAALAQLKGT